MASLRALRPHPFETLTGVVLVAGLVIPAAHGLPPTWASVVYTAGAMAKLLPGALLLGVFLQANYRVAGGGELRAYLRELARPGWWILWLRLWLACWLVSFAYFWLKLSVPLANARNLDGVLWELDTALHLGVSPGVALTALLGDTSFAGWVDVWYAVWLASVVWCLAFFAASGDAALRRGVVFSAAALWALGALGYLAAPALGPVYVFQDVWADVQSRMPRAAAAQALLWENRRLLLNAGGAGGFSHTLGIAALPSLHVGFHALFCFWAWRAARPLLWLFAPLTALTLLGSVLTGWHYAIDGYLGIALAYGCYRAAAVAERVPARETRKRTG